MASTVRLLQLTVVISTCLLTCKYNKLNPVTPNSTFIFCVAYQPTSTTTGASWSIGYISIKSIIHAGSPASKVHQWVKLFDLGHVIMPLAYIGVNGPLHALLPYLTSDWSEAVALVCCLVIYPLTILVNFPVNQPVRDALG